MTNSDITAAYYGVNPVSKIYLGDELVWPTTPVYSAMPLTFEIISGGTITWKTNDKEATFNVYPKTIEYSKDGGNTWTSITSASGSNAPTFSVVAGDIVQFRGNNSSYGGYYGFEHSQFTAGSGLKFNIYGNLYSLISKTNYTGITSFSTKYALNYLFYENGGLISAKNLTLLANKLYTGTYIGLFRGCSSLVDAPELPATTLGESCYSGMFSGTSITTAPELPATTLVQSCYERMFYGCTRLTTAPELPATTLKSYCYANMFGGCTRLNKVKCLATNITAAGCTSGWLLDVRSTGTFTKHPNMSSWTRDDSGIPTGWTVQDATI